MASLKYYYQQGYRYLEKTVNDPPLAVNYIRYGNLKASQLQVRRLAKGLKVETQEVNRYYQNPALEDLTKHIRKAAEGTPFVGVGSAGLDIYVLLRMFKPEVVVETGVEAGVSSSYILQALEDNNRGTLYSIDYRVPEGSFTESPALGLIPVEAIPQEKETGFVIPESYRSRWVFKNGKSSEILPGLLKELGRIDVFMHDSLHTYENMMFEFSAVWDYLPKGGLLLSHDTDFNNAFKDFSSRVKRKPIELTFRGGATALIK
jgi:hypothetical protein